MWCWDRPKPTTVTSYGAAHLKGEQVQRVYSLAAISPNSSYLVWPALATARASSTHMVSSREKEMVHLVCLRAQLKMMTRDLPVLKMAKKIKEFPLGGVTESEPANQKRGWWCHGNKNKARWHHQGYIKACHCIFPHSLASSQGGNISKKESTSHGIGKQTHYHIFTYTALRWNLRAARLQPWGS